MSPFLSWGSLVYLVGNLYWAYWTGQFLTSIFYPENLDEKSWLTVFFSEDEKISEKLGKASITFTISSVFVKMYNYFCTDVTEN